MIFARRPRHSGHASNAVNESQPLCRPSTCGYLHFCAHSLGVGCLVASCAGIPVGDAGKLPGVSTGLSPFCRSCCDGHSIWSVTSSLFWALRVLAHVRLANPAPSQTDERNASIGRGRCDPKTHRVAGTYRTAAVSERHPSKILEPYSSYIFHTTNENGTRKCRKSLILLVGGAGLEPATPAV